MSWRGSRDGAEAGALGVGGGSGTGVWGLVVSQAQGMREI